MNNIIFKHFSGLQPYEFIWAQMRDFTHARTPEHPVADQIWFLEHAPVYTQGQAGKSEHILLTQNTTHPTIATIPIIHSNRGGQVTYHGPGQLMVYLLLNLKTYDFHPKNYVQFLENTIIYLLNQYDIPSFTQPNAPGVYTETNHIISKIASIGIRIRKNYSYHGFCLNIAGDLTPFHYINPCGYSGLNMTQLSDFEQAKHISLTQIIEQLTLYFQEKLSHVYSI